MTIDQYQLCPGGCNKKIKFCCGNSIVSDINKVLTAVEGEQRVAALDHVNNAIEKKGDMDCLLNIKTNILLQLGEEEKARETSIQVLKKNPNNPIALANHGLLDASDGKLDSAVDKIQQALDLIEDNVPYSVIEAIRIVGVTLLQAGRITAARQHLVLYTGFNPEPDEQISKLISHTYVSPKIPLLLKNEILLEFPPADVPWKDECEEAIRISRRGRWLSAIEKLQELDEAFPDQPIIRKNIAVFQNWLGNAEDIAESWSDYAHTPGVEFDEAVEAEAFAQLIDPDLESGVLDVVSIRFDLTDFEKLTEKLSSDKRCDNVPVEQVASGEEDQPPPKASYLIFDKPRPESGENLTRQEIPNVVCQIYVYGKQTDRQARIEMVTTRNDSFDQKLEAAKAVLGDLISEEQETQVISHVTRLSDTLTWDWQFPPNTPREVQTKLLNEQRREIMLEKWPNLAQPSLGGKAPAEVAGQEKYQIALAASVLLLELSTDHQITVAVDLDQLRGQLQVPLRKTFKVTDFKEPNAISLVRLSQLEFEGMNDEALVALFQRAAMTSCWKALTRFCHEILQRDSLDEKIDKSSVYLMLARMEPELEPCIQLIQKARNVCIAKKASPARTLIAELDARIERGDVERAPDLIREIESKYIREPGIGNELMQVLSKYGIVDPRNMNAEPTAIRADEAAPADSNYVWTPENPAPAADQGDGGEKKLWVPGMD